MKRFFFFAVISACITQVTALEWPADSPDFIRLFGQRIHQHTMEQGLVFAQSDIVRAADNGMLLIEIERKQRIGAFPSALGNALVFLHDDGLQTIYGNLESAALFRGKTAAETGNIIGKTGNSGWGAPYDLLFQVADTQKKVYINPLLLLPSIDDKTAPQIRNIVLVNEQDNTEYTGTFKNIRQGSYDLYAEITDTVTESRNVSPFRITVLVNGTNPRIIPFEIIVQKENAFYLGDTALTDTLLYRRNNVFYLGKIVFTRGKTEILITARDITGNEKSEVFTVQAD